MSVYVCNCGLFQRPIEECPTKKCKPPNKRTRAPKVLVKEGIYATDGGDGLFVDLPDGAWGQS